MVKLIASDLDGTILRHGAQKVDKSTIEVIGKLLDAGLLFAPASGRQIVSLKRLFEPISDRLVYISENGALSEYRGEVIAKTAMERKLALQIIEDVYEQPHCEVLISGQHTAYIKPKTEEYLYRMTKVVNYKTTIIDKFSDIDEDILNINVSKNSSESINIFKKNIVLLIHNDVIKERVIRKIKLNGGNILNNIEEESVDLIVYQPHSKINEILEKAKKENIKVISLGIFNKMIMS